MLQNAGKQFNVGMEIDYEKSSNPNLTGLQAFISADRSVIPYDSTGNNFAARLTIDLGNDDLYLQSLSAYATAHWLSTSTPVLDYANAMVASEKTTVSSLETGWAQHVNGVSGVPPLAPAKLTGSLWLISGKPNCARFSTSDQKALPILSRQLHRTAPEPLMACSASCSGLPDARAKAPAVLFLPPPAKAAWESPAPRSISQFQCRHFVLNNSGLCANRHGVAALQRKSDTAMAVRYAF